jgi:hypothetical protein
VTIAAGFDLGGRNAADLQALGLPEDLITALTPYLGLRGQAAQDYLVLNPLNITREQAQQVDALVFNSFYNAVARNYNAAAAPGLRFQGLPGEAQTAIVDLAHQYGTNLAAATPNFWRQITTGQWQEAYNNLMNFGDDYSPRRQAEAGLLLNAINAGTLPVPLPPLPRLRPAAPQFPPPIPRIRPNR